MKTVEAFALSHLGDLLHVSDLCRAAGVGERTLQSAFREVTGLTPVAYLMRLRLHRARRALLEATQGSTTVSTVALDSGFWHFGDFSRAYRECFGELPSDTLRREPTADGGSKTTPPQPYHRTRAAARRQEGSGASRSPITPRRSRVSTVP